MKRMRKTTRRVQMASASGHWFLIPSATRSTLTKPFRRRKRKLAKQARKVNR
jgi:hypothetical protein